MSTDEAVSTESLNDEWSLVPNTNKDESTASNISNESEENETVQESENIDDNNGEEDSFCILSRITKETMAAQSNIVDRMSQGSAFSDIEEKLSDVLLENKKLKNILQQRDELVRKQYTTIVVLEKEVMQICDDYKKKFFEAKDIINRLKKENCQLRVVLESNNSSIHNAQNSVSHKSNSAVQNIRHRDVLETENGLSVTNDAPSERETRLIAKIRDLTQNLDDVRKSYLQIQSELAEIEDRHAIDLDQYSEQLRKSHEELKALKQKLDSTNHTELLKQITLSYKRKLETRYLCEVLFFLEKMCKESVEKILTQTSKQSSLEESSVNSNDILNYNKKLHELVTCFFETCARQLDAEEFPKECDNIVKIFKNTEISINNLSDTQTENEENEEYNVSNYHKMLLEEHLQSIKDSQTTMFIQRQYLKVLSDYNKVVRQLEVLKFENFKLFKDNCEIEEDNSENLAAIEKCLREDTQICKNEKASMIEARLDIEREKEEIQEDRDLLEAERKALLEEKDQIIEDQKEIINENLLLNQTIADLQQTEKSLKSNNASLGTQLEEAETELNEVKEELETANNNIAQLRHDLSKMIVNENELTAFKLQAEILESTITELREGERNFLTQIEHLSYQVYQLGVENGELRNRVQNPPQNNPQI